MPDRDFVKRGLAAAQLDAVRVALFHNSGDAWLADLPIAAKMTPDQREALIEKAADWLIDNASLDQLPEPAPADLRRMMEMATGQSVGDLEFAARNGIAGFADYPYMVGWDGPAPAIPKDFKVAIIGSGFAGIGMAMQLDLLGIPYYLLERRAEAGGVWSINRYPEVRVDTISVTYELGFEKDFSWTEYFGQGDEVRQHLIAASRKFGIQERTFFEHDVTKADFDKDAGLWRLSVQTPAGPEQFTANVLITCAGLFATPNMPVFEGQDSFTGEIVHSARWPEDLDLTGRRVGLIGNGSTGVQMLTGVAKKAAHVDVYQRTPQWISSREHYGDVLSQEYIWLIRNFPGYRNWWRYIASAVLFDTHKLMQVDPEWQAKGGLLNEGNDAMRRDMTQYIHDQTGGRKDLIDRLVPQYAPVSRRPVVDNSWYKSLTLDHVDLVDTPIARFQPSGIETSDGVLHPCDLIITATGYRVSEYLWPMRVKGAEGQDLHDEWSAADGARAYIGMMHAGFPNLFTIYGPNSQPISGGPAQPVWFATWSAYVARVLMGMLKEGKSEVDVTRKAYDDYNRALDEAASTLILMTEAGGADKNYYIHGEHARLQVNAPWYSPEYYRLCNEVDWAALSFSDNFRSKTDEKEAA